MVEHSKWDFEIKLTYFQAVSLLKMAQKKMEENQKCVKDLKKWEKTPGEFKNAISNCEYTAECMADIIKQIETAQENEFK